MLDVRKLVMLRAVAAEGSIAAAARALRYTRSAVSQQLSALEAEAGTPLVDRRGNRVTLTPAGRVLLEHTERILVELRAAEATLSGNEQHISGRLRVGVPFREGPQIMSHALMEVRRQFPKIEIQLIATTDETSADAVLRDQFDMAIVSRFGAPSARPRPGLREWDLGHDTLRLCVPGRAPAGPGRPGRHGRTERRSLDRLPRQHARAPGHGPVCLGGLPAGTGRLGGRHRHGGQPGRDRLGGDHRPATDPAAACRWPASPSRASAPCVTPS